MIPYIGDFAEDEEIYHYFNTFDSNDPSASVTATDLADADIFVYKDGSVTDIVTDGATVVLNFDGRTGLHKITIATNAHADYSVGSDYMVMVNGITVDAATINAGLFTFSIENRYNAAADDLANGTDGLGALKTLIDTAQTDLDTITGTAGVLIGTDAANVTEISDAVWDEAQSGHTTAGTFGEIATEIASVLVDTGEIGTAGAGLTNLGASGNDWNTVTPDAAGVAPTAAEIETEVWDALQSAHVIADSMGAMATELALIPTTAMRGTDSAATSAKQDTMETTLNAAATTAELNKVPKSDGTTSWNSTALTAIENEVWDGLQSAHVGAGSMGVIASEIATLQSDVTAVKVPTDKMVFTKANELDVNTKSINDAEVIGDGNATPWDGI